MVKIKTKKRKINKKSSFSRNKKKIKILIKLMMALTKKINKKTKFRINKTNNKILWDK